MRIVPLAAVLWAAATSYPLLADFGGFDGFSVPSATRGLHKNVTAGLWVPDELKFFGSGGPVITFPRDARSVEPLNLLDRVLFDDTGKAIGFELPWLGTGHVRKGERMPTEEQPTGLASQR